VIRLIKIINDQHSGVAVGSAEQFQNIKLRNLNEQIVSVKKKDIFGNIKIANPKSTQTIIVKGFYSDSEDLPFYDGSYEVTPKIVEQKLMTANKVMEKDVIIERIPITTVSNSSGGNTVIIGG
jgi:hypothetical protein